LLGRVPCDVTPAKVRGQKKHSIAKNVKASRACMAVSPSCV
jgi:hypothetical protein